MQKLLFLHFHESGHNHCVEAHICPKTLVRDLLKTFNREDFCLFRESSGLKQSPQDDLFCLEDGEHLVGIRDTWVDKPEDD